MLLYDWQIYKEITLSAILNDCVYIGLSKIRQLMQEINDQ